MAKLFASEVAMEIALNAVRIHGGYGYSTEYDVERYFRDAPLMIVGEGTNEIQRNVIAGAAGRPGRDLGEAPSPRIRLCANSFATRSPRACTATARGCPPSPNSLPATACRGRPCGGRSRTWWPRAWCTGYRVAALTPASRADAICVSSGRSKT